MNHQHEPLRDRLLAQAEPDQEAFATYQKDVRTMFAKNERTLGLQKWYAGIIWIFVVLLGTTFLVIGGMRPDTSVGVWLGIFACFLRRPYTRKRRGAESGAQQTEKHD